MEKIQKKKIKDKLKKINKEFIFLFNNYFAIKFFINKKKYIFLMISSLFLFLFLLFFTICSKEVILYTDLIPYSHTIKLLIFILIFSPIYYFILNLLLTPFFCFFSYIKRRKNIIGWNLPKSNKELDRKIKMLTEEACYIYDLYENI